MAIWVVTASVNSGYGSTPSARADQTVTDPSDDPSADRELQRAKNRAEADRRQVKNWQSEQQLTDPSDEPSADREVQRFENRVVRLRMSGV